MEIDINPLLAQRPPFLFLERLLTANQQFIEGCYTFHQDDHPMLGGGLPHIEFVPGMIGVEALAQCGGAGIRYLELAEGLFGLASIENVAFHGGIPFGNEIILRIHNIKTTARIIKQSGEMLKDNQLLVSATWTCIKL